uniref:Uncharacterized protein n=1 Tax=Strongyloides papillosus TaxID=174720 RepID=A0A0N5BZQ9_STREA
MECQPYKPRFLHESMSRLGVLCQGKRDNPLETTTINIAGDIIEVPLCLLENGALFKSIFTKSVFYSLPLQKQQYLCKFLPRINGKTLDEHLTNAFTPYPLFGFPNNLEKLRFKLKNNHFDPSYLKSFIESREMKRVLFEHFYKQYNLRLMKKLFISRHEVLENAVTSGNIPSSSRKGNQIKKRKLEYDVSCRASIRAKRMLDEVKRLANDPNPYSSDEEEVDVKEFKDIKAKSTIFNSKISDYDLHEPTEKVTTIKKMLKENRRLKECHPDSLLLDTEGITLLDVYKRAGLNIKSERRFIEQQKERSIDRNGNSLPFRMWKR